MQKFYIPILFLIIALLALSTKFINKPGVIPQLNKQASTSANAKFPSTEKVEVLPQADTTGWHTVTLSTHNFSIKVPPGWGARWGYDDSFHLITKDIVDESTGAFVSMDSKTPERISAAFRDRRIKSLVQFLETVDKDKRQVLFSNKLLINEYESIERGEILTFSGEKKMGINTYILAEGNVFEINLYTLSPAATNILTTPTYPEYKKILSTFKLL